MSTPYDPAELFEIRRRKLKLLRSEFPTLVEFARRIEQSASYTSRMLQGGQNRKNIGESMARRIEQACGKPIGWLDQEEDAKGHTKSHAKEPWPFNFSREDWDALTKQQRHELESTFEKLILGYRQSATHRKRTKRAN